MTTQHTDEMREAFEKWFVTQYGDTPEAIVDIFWKGWQAATASAEAKFLPVIEKLVETLRQHHKWHQELGEVKIKLGNNEWLELDLSLEYSDSSLCEKTCECLELSATAE